MELYSFMPAAARRHVSHQQDGASQLPPWTKWYGRYSQSHTGLGIQRLISLSCVVDLGFAHTDKKGCGPALHHLMSVSEWLFRNCQVGERPPATNRHTAFSRMAIFLISTLQIHEQGSSFHLLVSSSVSFYQFEVFIVQIFHFLG